MINKAAYHASAIIKSASRRKITKALLESLILKHNAKRDFAEQLKP